jgi:chromosome segregation ATPase
MPESTYITKELHDETIRRIDDENDRQNARLSALEQGLKEVNKITLSVERLAANIETMTAEIKKQGARLDEIEQKPVKRWDTVVSGIISGIIGLLIGLISAGVIK